MLAYVLYVYLTTSQWQSHSVRIYAYQTLEACNKAADRQRRRHRQIITNCVRVAPI